LNLPNVLNKSVSKENTSLLVAIILELFLTGVLELFVNNSVKIQEKELEKRIEFQAYMLLMP
jgi:hypothetical protein